MAKTDQDKLEEWRERMRAKTQILKEAAEKQGIPVVEHSAVDVCLAGAPAVDGVCGDSDCVCAMDPDRPSKEEYVEAARELYCVGSDDDIEIDGDVKISQNSEGGCWVQAWVYVRDYEVDEKYAEKEEEES